jgi:hypothetical protein
LDQASTRTFGRRGAQQETLAIMPDLRFQFQRDLIEKDEQSGAAQVLG